jgi:hypothetical protein
MPADVHLLQEMPHRAVALLVPALVAGIFIAIIFLTLPQDKFLSLSGLITAYLLPPAGKETVIPIGVALGIPWWYMALSVVTVDAIFGLFMALNFDLAYKIPYLGPAISDLTDRTQQFIAEHRWFASLWFFAIVLMVMVPFFGSGGIRGSIAGKLLGLSTTLTFLAILTGSLTGCLFIALGSDVLFAWLCANGMFPTGFTEGLCGS